MARLYADEQFPRAVSEMLRTIGHDVLTVGDNRTVVTLNRQDFIRLHRVNSEHFGIVVCTNDTDRLRMATRIDEAIAAEESLQGKLIRVVRPAS
jgi:hypothetical protein